MFSAACLARGIAVLAVALVPLAVSAQPSAAADSLPFRAGQWGAEFGLGNFASAGVLRFRSPSRAWVGTVAADYTRRSPESSAPVQTAARLDLSAGHRWFRSVLPDVSQFVTLGGVVGLQRLETSVLSSILPLPGSTPTTLRSTVSRSSTFVGVVADVGAQWMVAPSLSLGAKWGASAVVSRDRETNTAGSSTGLEQRGSTLGLSLGRVAILGTLYF